MLRNDRPTVLCVVIVTTSDTFIFGFYEALDENNKMRKWDATKINYKA
jgi:hypothetical protein